MKKTRVILLLVAAGLLTLCCLYRPVDPEKASGWVIIAMANR